MANFEIDEEVLVAFLKGELDAAQAAAVEAWYDRSAANRRMLGQVYYILYVSDRINDAAGIDVERSLRQFKRRMHAGRRISLRRSAVRIAAAAVIAAVLLAGGLTTVLLSKRLAQPVTVVTQLGERSQVVLPDGTKVWLNSSSSVEYVAPFFSRQRRVKMEGEAYFEVEHDRRAPFVVSTNGLDIEVLGTRFNIRNDDNEHRVTTVLLEGAVKAYASGREQASVRLHPAQQLVFDTRTHAMRLTDCPSAERSINWIDGQGVSATQALMDRWGASQDSADARENGGVWISEDQKVPDARVFYANNGNGLSMLSHYVYSMTNVRLRELTLGYDLPSRWFNDKIGMTVSLVGRNLWMLYNKAPFDPEITASTGTYYQGLDYFMQPSARTIGFSVRLQF